MPKALSRTRSVLLIVDVQERLAAVMPKEPMARLEGNVGILLETARRMSIPVVVSEQYPKGLGTTISTLSPALSECDELIRIEKLAFSVCAAEGFSDVLARMKGMGRTAWIVVGMEAHICVYQSVRALAVLGNSVHVPVDAVVSRAKHNYEVGLRLSQACGAELTSTETIVMDLLAVAQGPDFKAISKLIR